MNKHIYGIHDRGGAHALKGKGWVVISEAIGDEPTDWSTTSYDDLADQGLGVIVRLNYGYNPNGTIPVAERYPQFAKRCGNFVERSDGCHIWIIGNETNLAVERPQGQTIQATKYANCFLQCRREIKSRSGHSDDQVIIAAVGPWNTETGPWIKYFTDVLWELNPNTEHGFQLDGISIHTYSRGSSPESITAPTKMDPPFSHLHSGFQTYRDFMEAIPSWARCLPVYITETDQNEAWEDVSSGWVQAAYAEIDRWNRGLGHQQILCLTLYRYERYDKYYIRGKGGVVADLHAAIDRGYTWGTQKPTPTPPEITKEEIRNLAWNAVGVPYNPTHAFPRYAREHNLGAPLRDTLDYKGVRIQPFMNGVVFCPIEPVEQWDLTSHIPW